MKLKIWQVDAFASKPLEGNPAAIVPLESWLDAGPMQAIAAENNVAETAFFVKTGAGAYDLRWFAPNREVDLCGHATLASAWVIFNKLDTGAERSALHDPLRRVGGDARRWRQCHVACRLPTSRALHPARRFRRSAGQGLGGARAEGTAYQRQGRRRRQGLDRGVGHARTRSRRWSRTPISRSGDAGGRGLGAGHRGRRRRAYDMVSRFFAPYYGVPEDPVTGSAHCALTPFWAKRLGKKTLKARQASPRGGDLLCTDDGARTIIQGDCALYLTGEIEV